MKYSFVARQECPSCASTDTELMYRCGFSENPIRTFISEYYRVDPELLSNGSYILDRCARCRLLFQREVGDDELLAQLYGNWIETDADPESDPQYKDDVGDIPKSRDAHEIEAAAAHLRVRPGDMRTLDYGMGWALWARIASSLGCDSYGSDLSPARMHYAASHGITCLADDEIGPGMFHFINCEQVFEHVPRPRELAERLAASLVPGGILKISVPAGDGADRIIPDLRAGKPARMPDIMPVQPLEHVNCFSKLSLEILASDLGLRIAFPSLPNRYAYLRHRSAIAFGKPSKLLKEAVRPFYQFNNRRNLYRWLQKDPV